MDVDIGVGVGVSVSVSVENLKRGITVVMGNVACEVILLILLCSTPPNSN